MNFLDLTLPSPAENLAGDEALLDWAEAGEGGPTLRFWESPEPFVVVGYANRVAAEVNVAACAARKIPVLRRCSGGGTVVQGPGCLNYALILPISPDGPFHNITQTNQFIMQRNGQAIEAALRAAGRLPDGAPAVVVRGYTDLAWGNKKFSGNSQRRHKKFLLFHGAFLLRFDLELIAELLPMPSRQPAYRENRSHREFLRNLDLPPETVKAALRQVWNARTSLLRPPWERIAALTREKYSLREWNFKF
ncbi:MAG TPA: lipoate--protein ligase family protein [Verrucomicrobiae bacterium]|nr:lipoate--protein ligase family protein [Verrucomicrobiae bacterium]